MRNERLAPVPFVALIAAMFSFAACGGASAEVRAAYATETTVCIARVRAIVDRQGTTEEQDRAALAEERARCDAALAAIEHGGE